MHYSRESSSLGSSNKKEKKNIRLKIVEEDLKKIEKEENNYCFFKSGVTHNDIFFFYLSLVLVNEILGYEIFIDKAAACRIWNSIMFFGEWNIFEVFFEYFTNLSWHSCGVSYFSYLIKKII